MANPLNKKAAWHYTPELPISSSPIFDWPQPVGKVLIYFFGAGFLFSQRTLYAVLALLAWHYWMPELALAATLSWSWIGQVLLVIFGLNLLSGWAYHWLFYTSGLNAKQCKYDKRLLATNSPRFLFSNQLWDKWFGSFHSGTEADTVLVRRKKRGQ